MASGAPDDKSDTTSSCALHGIDGDARLTMRDVILARKGAGVKTSNVTGANFSPGSTFQETILGGAATVSFTRGWVSADVSVRGKRFHLVNTHLESENDGLVPRGSGVRAGRSRRSGDGAADGPDRRSELGSHPGPGQ